MWIGITMINEIHNQFHSLERNIKDSLTEKNIENLLNDEAAETYKNY